MYVCMYVCMEMLPFARKVDSNWLGWFGGYLLGWFEVICQDGLVVICQDNQVVICQDGQVVFANMVDFNKIEVGLISTAFA